MTSNLRRFGFYLWLKKRGSETQEQNFHASKLSSLSKSSESPSDTSSRLWGHWVKYLWRLWDHSVQCLSRLWGVTGGGSQFLPLYFNTSFQFVFHKIAMIDLRWRICGKTIWVKPETMCNICSSWIDLTKSTHWTELV